MPENFRQHEVAFCAEVSKWADHLFEVRPTLPFGSSDIESFGRGSNKRQDLRFYERKDAGRGKLALCGEVKLPGTPQGRSPFDVTLMQDAFDKATRENCRYFFTWNVEELALFDRSRWDAETMHERCIGQWKLGSELNKPTDVTRAEVGLKIQNDFLPRLKVCFPAPWGQSANYGTIWGYRPRSSKSSTNVCASGCLKNSSGILIAMTLIRGGKQLTGQPGAWFTFSTIESCFIKL
jgi:hypothetical protein